MRCAASTSLCCIVRCITGKLGFAVELNQLAVQRDSSVLKALGKYFTIITTIKHAWERTDPNSKKSEIPPHSCGSFLQEIDSDGEKILPENIVGDIIHVKKLEMTLNESDSKLEVRCTCMITL